MALQAGLRAGAASSGADPERPSRSAPARDAVASGRRVRQHAPRSRGQRSTPNSQPLGTNGRTSIDPLKPRPADGV
jgi:hypothetical protein